MVVVLFVSSSNHTKEGPNKRGPFPFAPEMFPVQASDQYDVGLTRCSTQNQKSQESSHVTVYSRAGCSVSPLGIQGTWQSPIQKQQRKHASMGWTPEAPVRVEVCRVLPANGVKVTTASHPRLQGLDQFLSNLMAKYTLPAPIQRSNSDFFLGETKRWTEGVF